MKWSGNESMAVPPWENLASFPGSSTPEPGNEAIESSRESRQKQKQGIKWRALLLEPLNFCSKGVCRSCAMEDGETWYAFGAIPQSEHVYQWYRWVVTSTASFVTIGVDQSFLGTLSMNRKMAYEKTPQKVLWGTLVNIKVCFDGWAVWLHAKSNCTLPTPKKSYYIYISPENTKGTFHQKVHFTGKYLFQQT